MKTAQEIVDSRQWFHSFEVVPGVWTPGRSNRIDPQHVLSDLHAIPDDLTGKRALDIGALDGPYTFELERRGAIVTAVDIQNPDRMGFNTAKKLRNSSAEYVQGNVYDLSERFAADTFDVILFFGVWYHLKNPVRAFEQINHVLKADGILAAEGECLLNHMEFPNSDLSVANLSRSEVPLSVFYPNGVKGDVSSWYVPNAACVRAWLRGTGFEPFRSSFEDQHPHQRMRVSARKRGRVRVDNPVW